MKNKLPAAILIGLAALVSVFVLCLAYLWITSPPSLPSPGVKGKPDRKPEISLEVGRGGSTRTVDCDSFQMEGFNRVYVWVKGTKMRIDAEIIRPSVRRVHQ